MSGIRKAVVPNSLTQGWDGAGGGGWATSSPQPGAFSSWGAWQVSGQFLLW